MLPLFLRGNSAFFSHQPQMLRRILQADPGVFGQFRYGLPATLQSTEDLQTRPVAEQGEKVGEQTAFIDTQLHIHVNVQVPVLASNIITAYRNCAMMQVYISRFLLNQLRCLCQCGDDESQVDSDSAEQPIDGEDVCGQIAATSEMSSSRDLPSTDAVADAELETLESILREPLPELEAKFVAEPGCQRVVELIAAIGCGPARDRGEGQDSPGIGPPAEADDNAAAEPCPAETATVTFDPASLEPVELGEYQLLEKLGQGGMGAVYKARHVRLDKIVAVKVMPPERMTDPQAVARFEREMKAVGRVDHPNIVRAMDARAIAGTHFLVMEYAAGMDLGDVVLQTGGLRIADACEVVRQLAVGLQCAHENGLIHRDIKPSNAILTRTGQVKILDLGLARLNAGSEAEGNATDMTSFGTATGTADYIAPEQAKDSHTADIRADIYSLGCTLYTLLAGRPPFTGPKYKSHMDKITGHLRDTPPPIGLLRVDVPPGLAMVINQRMAKNREDRYATPQQVIEAVTPFVAGADLNRLVSEALAMKLGAQPAAPSSVGTEPGVSSAMSDTARRGKQVANAPAAAEMADANRLPETQPFAISLNRRSRKSPAKRASARPRSRLQVGLALLGAAILAGIIVITIRSREGKKVGELTVSDDHRVEIAHRAETPSGRVQPADPCRRCDPNGATPGSLGQTRGRSGRVHQFDRDAVSVDSAGGI